MADNTPFITDIVDAIDDGQPTKAYKTSDNRYLKIHEAQSEMAAGRLAPQSKYTAQPVTGIPMKTKTPKEYEDAQKYNRGLSTESNVAAYNEAIPGTGADVEAAQTLLKRYNIAGTSEGEKALAEQTKRIAGIKAPNADIQNRMNFEFGPMTDIAKQHVAGTPETPFEKTAMNLGQEAVSNMPDGGQFGRPMKETEAAFDKAREASMQQEEKPVPIPKPPKPPAVPKSQFSELTPKEQAALNRAIDNGLDPHQINSRTAKTLAQLEIAEPGRKWPALVAASKYQVSPTATNTISLGRSLYPLIDGLQASYDKLQNSPVPIVNTVINWGKEQTGDPAVVEFDNRRNDFVFELTRFATQVGAASDARIIMLQKMLERKHSPAQFMAATKAAKALIDSRLDAIREGPSGHGSGLQKTTGIPRSTTPAGAQTHPQASQAEQWARQHPNDPRAKTILQRLGAQ